MSFQETFDINYYYYHCYCTFIDCRQKKVSHNFDKKKLIKIIPKRGKIIYLRKGVNVNFFLYLTFYQNFKIHNA